MLDVLSQWYLTVFCCSSCIIIYFPCAGNHVFNPKEDTDAQSKILALLLHKSLVPVDKDDLLGEI